MFSLSLIHIFDVDDLLCNTLGGMLGYYFTKLLERILPDRDKIDEKSYKKGERVSFTRRFLSFAVDLFFVSIFTGFLDWVLPVSDFWDDFLFAAAYLLYFGVFQWLWKGKSLGKRMTKLCIGICYSFSKPQNKHTSSCQNDGRSNYKECPI